PDLDLVLYPLIAKPLGYLLHHRGHSHTFLWEIPQALLLFFGTMLCWPKARRLVKSSVPAKRGAILTLVLGFVLHISMDFLNSYGVHPLAPFDSHWYYGDMVFIIEPIFWATLGVAAVMAFKNKYLKAFWLLFLLGIPAFATFKDYLPWLSLALLLASAAAIAIVQARSKPRDVLALSFAVAVAVAFIIVQGFASSRAKEDIKYALEKKDEGFRVLDSAVNSFPSNPLCWSYTTISLNEHLGTYRLRNGVVSLKPDVLPVSKCSPGLFRGYMPDENSPDYRAEIVYFGSFDGNWAEIKKLNQADCHFNAWMRFARMPYVTSTSAVDLRFAVVSARGNFTALNFENFKNQACPTKVPQWIPPRQDLLN
ncbi:MAG: metal-dependent hydrolase, partial [Proteobacteria bacterium]